MLVNCMEWKKVWAALFHKEDGNVRHQFCPREANFWCLWQADKIIGKATYKRKLTLPLSIKCDLIIIFWDLPDLRKVVEKCTHGKTLNNNESLNDAIWKTCLLLESVYVSEKVLELSVYSAMLGFSETSSYCVISRGFGVAVHINIRNVTKFTGKHQWQGLFYNKVTGLRPATL